MPTHGPFEITIREHHQANQAFWWHPTRRPLDHHATTDERSALALGLRILRAQRREVAAEPLYVRRWHNLGDQRCPACKSITGHASWCDR